MEFVLPLLTLTAMEVVLGIDNIVFISILVGNLPEEKRKFARYLGLGLALVARLGLLFGIRFIMGLEKALFHWSSIGWVPDLWVQSHHVDAVTGKDLVLIGGGAFLVAKAVLEIHKKTMGDEHAELTAKAKRAAFGSVIFQIIVLDLVFSLDSVISAIGMVKQVWIMVVAMLVAVVFMTVFSGGISRFIEKNPTFKMLALAFLVMIGVVLVADGFGQEISKGYIYAAMVFSLAVELLNMRSRKKKEKKQTPTSSAPSPGPSLASPSP